MKILSVLSNNGFAESQIQDMERDEGSGVEYVEDYDYADDSDLEDGSESADEDSDDDDTVLSLDSLSLGAYYLFSHLFYL